jgi:hypothetical protein
VPRPRLGLFLVAALLLTMNGTAAADPNPPTDDWVKSPNMEPLGWAPRPAVYDDGSANSDLAFWGDIAYQGTYFGFHIVDISNPEDPVTINNYEDCKGNQGDVIIWENILVRSWNSPAPANSTCDGDPVPQNWEGIHIFDVSNPADPDLVQSIETTGGSHTATGVPDPGNDRLIVYSNPGFDIIEIPLANPAGATIVGVGDTGGRSCHDVAVILGDLLRAACAGGNGFSMLSLGGARGGTLTQPVLLYTHPMPATAQVTVGHAATFSWDGEIMVFGHEPGGGAQAQCEELDKLLKRQTIYLFYTETGTQIGEFTLPRGQSDTENCTVHNYNVVPSATRNILVSGSYQMGISVIDFTNPGAPEQIAFADPPPLTPQQLGGDWSTYWYDGYLYETDITRGLITWRLNDPRVADARTLGHLNPQTQEEIFAFTGKIGGGVEFECRDRQTTIFGTAKKDVLKGTPKRDVFSLGNGKDRVRGAGGNDTICGGRGKDRLLGGGDKDFLIGGPGVDDLIGGSGDQDACRSGKRSDNLRGCERGR